MAVVEEEIHPIETPVVDAHPDAIILGGVCLPERRPTDDYWVSFSARKGQPDINVWVGHMGTSYTPEEIRLIGGGSFMGGLETLKDAFLSASIDEVLGDQRAVEIGSDPSHHYRIGHDVIRILQSDANGNRQPDIELHLVGQEK